MTPAPLLGALPTAKLDAATAKRLQAALDSSVAARAGPDLIAAVITPDGTWAGAAGIDGPNDRRAQVGDEFAIASVSKMVLAALLMRLAEQGKIDLDAPLASYLEGVGVDANGATVRQALAMRSGLGDTIDGALDRALADCGRAWTREDVVASIPPPFASPNTVFHYSNPTYKALGFAVEKVTGQSLAAALKSDVLDPVGVGDRMLLQGPQTTTPKPWALPIEGHGEPLALSKYGSGGALPCLADATLSLGAAGMASDVSSLARWGWELFAGRVVSPDSLAAMMDIGADDYGLGMQRFPDFLPEVVYGHTGSKGGYKAILVYVPARQTVAAVFINDGDADEIGYARKLLEAVGP
jgi:D-alanyl-D-alanine carboxypeptidase